MRRPLPRLLVTVPLAVALLACSGAPDAPDARTPAETLETPAPSTVVSTGAPVPGDAASAVAPAVTLLETRLALARADAFYLILDPAASELRLYYGGALLQTWPVLQIATARPQIAFARAADALAWHSVTWTGGTLAPGRPVEEGLIVPPDPDAEEEDPEAAIAAAAVLPPTAEESIPVPPRYRIRFREGVALEVRRTGGATGWWARQRAALVARALDVGSVLGAASRDRLRVRVTLEAAAADALYRALPPDASLLILPPAGEP